jgi:zinc protease
MIVQRWLWRLLGVWLPFSALHAHAAVLKNGSTLVAEKAAFAPRSSLVICFAGGPAEVPEDKQGLTAVLREMLDEGSANSSPEEYLQQLFLLNGAIELREVPRGLLLQIKVPDDKFKDGLNLAKEILTHPRLDSESFQRAVKTIVSETQNRQEDMAESIFYFARRSAFGYSPDSFDGRGSLATVKSLKLDDIKSYAPRLLSLKRTSYWYVGHLPESEVAGEINRTFLNDGDQTVEKVKFKDAAFEYPDSSHPKVTLIEKQGSVDNQVYYLFPDQFSWDSNDRANAEVLSEILGGGLSGRLSNVLREQRGLTYHVGSTLEFELPGWDIWTFGATPNIEKLMAGVDEVLADFQKGIFSAKEVREAKMQVLTSFRQDQELPKDRLFERIRYGLFGRDPAFLSRYPAAIEGVTLASVRHFLKGHFKTDKGRIYLMGDVKALVPILKKRRFPKERIKIVSLE